MKSFWFLVYKNNILMWNKEIEAKTEEEANSIMKAFCDARNVAAKRGGRIGWSYKEEK